MSRIAAIVGTYQSDLDDLSRLLDAVAPQVANIVIVGNDPALALDVWLAHREVQYVSMGSNRGSARHFAGRRSTAIACRLLDE